MPCTMKQFLTEINQPKKTKIKKKKIKREKREREKVLRPDKYKNN